MHRGVFAIICALLMVYRLKSRARRARARAHTPQSTCGATREPQLGRPKVGLGIYIYSCHAGELFGFVPVARDEQAFSC